MIFKSMSQITPKELGSRKKLQIYLAVDMNNYYNLIVYISKKSRFIQKDANDLIDLHSRVEKLKDIIIKKRILLIDTPICSKAKSLLIEEGWRLFEI